ncbi:hypothetical protein ABEY59_00175 [Bacillus albus]|uniref:hypothetical protein n=1 Tax=Bacillus albus TaxID=2026189 RepID=UPI003D25D08F
MNNWFNKAKNFFAITTFIAACFYFVLIFIFFFKIIYNHFGFKSDIINLIIGTLNVIVMGCLTFLVYRATKQGSKVQEEIHKSHERELNVNRAAMLLTFKESAIHIRGNLITLYHSCTLPTIPIPSPIPYQKDVFFMSIETYLNSCDKWIREYSFYKERGWIVKHLLQHYIEIEEINHDIMVSYNKITKIYKQYQKGTDPTNTKELVLNTANFLPANLRNILPIQKSSHYATNEWVVTINKLIEYWDAEWWEIENTFPK